MLFPKFTEGLESVLFIALNSGADPVSSKQICSYQDVLPRHLEPVLQILVKEGILKGTKGPRGGYTLAREKRKISVGEIFSLLSNETLASSKQKDRECNSIRKDIISKVNNEIASSIEASLQTKTIEDLCKLVEYKIKTGSKPDFHI